MKEARKTLEEENWMELIWALPNSKMADVCQRVNWVVSGMGSLGNRGYLGGFMS